MKGIGKSKVDGRRAAYSDMAASTVSQTVKEVLQSLVDDGLVQAEKIGSSNCMLLGSGLVWRNTDYMHTYAQSSGVFRPNAGLW
jgi:predicted transcriptional regulator